MQAVLRPLVWLFLCTVLLVPRANAHPELELQIDQLTLQLEQQPGRVGLLLKRGDLQRRHENWDLARMDYRRVREIDPKNNFVDWFEGRLEVESGHATAGLKLLDQFLESNPAHAIALQNRAQAHLLLQQPLLAARDYQSVIQLSSKPAPSLYSAGALALVTAGSGYFAQAMDMIGQGLKQFPGEVTLTGLGMDISLAVSDVATARDLMNTLPESILGLPQWKTRLALLQCQAGQQEQARAWFTSAGQSLPGSRQSLSSAQKSRLARLAIAPTTENCQAVALEILQSQ